MCGPRFIACCCVAVLLSVSLATPCVSRGDPPNRPAHAANSDCPISEGAVRQHVKYLASPELEGRGDLPGKKLAADYIRKHFQQYGLKPLFAQSSANPSSTTKPGATDLSYFQEIPGLPSTEGEPIISGRNVGAWLPGSDPALKDEFIIVSAHYDHLGVRNGKLYPGADDNASGVAMLLEVARAMAVARDKPRRSMVFVSFDLEEQLLWGSRWFVAHPPWPLKQVKLFITADLIGRSLGNLPLKSIFVMGSENATGLKQVVQAAVRPGDLEVAHLGIDLVGTRSDYGPFWTEKIPFLFFSSGEHPDYHTPFDTPDRVDNRKVTQVSCLVLDICRNVAGSETTPVWTNTPLRDLDEVQVLKHITDLLLQADDKARIGGKRTLSDVQRFLVSNVNVKTGQMIKRGKVTEEERPWLVRASQVLLLTVF